MGKHVTCQRCQYQWEYNGASDWYTSCPRCKTNVRVGAGIPAAGTSHKL